MLKTTILLQVFIANKMLIANEVSGIKGGNESIKKCKKLSKIRKLLESLKLSKSGNLKGKKSSKFRKSAKSRKKLSTSKNLSNFDTKKNKLSFLIPNARTAFNCLRLVFTKASIL